jgi:hypothetical protein
MVQVQQKMYGISAENVFLGHSESDYAQHELCMDCPISLWVLIIKFHRNVKSRFIHVRQCMEF